MKENDTLLDDEVGLKERIGENHEYATEAVVAIGLLICCLVYEKTGKKK